MWIYYTSINHRYKSVCTLNFYFIQLAIQGIVGILQQHKRKHPTVFIDPRKVNPKSEMTTSNNKAGHRNDNAWLQLREEHVPKSEEEWNQLNFVHKTHWGYYCWPK